MGADPGVPGKAVRTYDVIRGFPFRCPQIFTSCGAGDSCVTPKGNRRDQ